MPFVILSSHQAYLDFIQTNQYTPDFPKVYLGEPAQEEGGERVYWAYGFSREHLEWFVDKGLEIRIGSLSGLKWGEESI